ncbi:hypothetical protein PLESTF_001970500, partial [Pleodorina starrii]
AAPMLGLPPSGSKRRECRGVRESYDGEYDGNPDGDVVSVDADPHWAAESGRGE